MRPLDILFAVAVAVISGLALVASRIALDELSPALMTMPLSQPPQAIAEGA